MFIDEKDAMADEKDAAVDEESAVAEEPGAGTGGDTGSGRDGGQDPSSKEGTGEPSGQIAAGEEVEGPEADHPDEPSPPDADVQLEPRGGGEPGKASRPTKRSQKTRRHQGPSQKEVLERLLEKNEVILQLTKKNVELDAKVKDIENRRLRLAAEFENYRKRTRKEWELLKDQTKAEVLSEVLNVVDDFDRAFEVLGDREDNDFVKGIRLIYNNLTSILEGFGLERMNSLGELFDPNLHMAVATIETREAEPNHIVEVIQEGYLMGDAVVRIAKVVIAK